MGENLNKRLKIYNFSSHSESLNSDVKWKQVVNTTDSLEKVQTFLEGMYKRDKKWFDEKGLFSKAVVLVLIRDIMEKHGINSRALQIWVEEFLFRA